ncbi:FAD binding domain-containing protein [Colletotrichum musicola]|uniref:FAD binding domain-containing protein n=1 Tax=Colletotrichum musicola TaxID=2175873 RepID=A0A8H6IUW0_9PEZI|nr:FAD binding domain-containing protein [Colletotrichum musicola]
MAFAVKVLVKTKVPFAVRGGGHMPIGDSNNINSTGILLSSSGFTKLRLSKDKSTVTVGPANSWGDVYRYLEPAGVSVVGGRLGVVGIPGFLLGGGMSFFTNEYGWGSANTRAHSITLQVVLADGKVVTATAKNKYGDLFWALRGGGNSFAIITSMELNTVSAPIVTVGTVVYREGQRDNFLDTIYNYAIDGSLDKKSAVIPNIFWSGEAPEALTYMSYLFYNGNDTRPSALINFTSAEMPTDLADFQPRTMGQWATATEVGWEQLHGRHSRFWVLSFQANREAMTIVHDTFFELITKYLADVPGIGATLTFMPISKSSITANRGGGPASDPMGIDESQGPFIWVEESLGFVRAEDEDIVTRFYEALDLEIFARLNHLRVLTPYLYLNDAGKSQPVFEGYDPANLRRLRRIRHKYDPERIYTDQMPGGFKVEAAQWS